MAYASPASLVASASVWLVVFLAAVLATDWYAAPFVGSVLREHLAGTVIGNYVDGIVLFCRFILLLQTLSLVVFLKRLLAGARAYSLQNKHVVITGGSQGLGMSIARQCLARGAKVTLVVR